jgi:hypothetical protein
MITGDRGRETGDTEKPIGDGEEMSHGRRRSDIQVSGIACVSTRSRIRRFGVPFDSAITEVGTREYVIAAEEHLRLSC